MSASQRVLKMGDYTPAQRLAVARATGDRIRPVTIGDRSALRALVKRGLASEDGTLLLRGRMLRMSIMASARP